MTTKEAKNKIEGFTLIEILVGVFLMLLVFLGIFNAYQLSMKVIGQSKARITAVAIGNQEIEKIRNLSYENVGTYECKPAFPNCDGLDDSELIPGYPKGIIKKVFSVFQNGAEYVVTARIDYVDDPKDNDPVTGIDYAVNCPNGFQYCANDYKKINLKIEWFERFGGEIFFNDIVAPGNCYEECGERGGILKVSVIHKNGDPVTFPAIEVENINSASANFGLTKTANPDDGDHFFILPPDVDAYQVKVSKLGYSSDQTYGSDDVYNGQIIANPQKPHRSISEGVLETITFKIDKLSEFSIKILEAKAEHIYYVRKSGNDDHTGLSPDEAFLTIQKAAQTMTAGDMVFVGAGDYAEEVSPHNSGTSENKIIYVADVSGGYAGDAGDVKISGQDYGFHILNKKYIKIYGFEIYNTNSAAVYIEGVGSSDVEIINNDFSNNNSYGIHIENASDISITHNSICSNNSGGIFLDNSDNSFVIANYISQNLLDGIKINSSASASLEFNEIFSNGANGIFAYSNSNQCQIKNNTVYLNTLDGIKIFDHASSLNVSENKSYSNQGSGIVFEKHIVNANSIISNLTYANQKSGIVLSDNSVNNTVSNNTSFKNLENGILIEIGSNNNEIKDNIISDNVLAGIKVSGSPTVNNSYNNLWQNSPNYDGISADPTDISQDSIFVDPDGVDNILGGSNGEDDSFYLSQIVSGQAQDSPCLDSGSDTALNLGMSDKTTRTDESLDVGNVDLGFHYFLSEAPALPSVPDPFGVEIPNVNFHLLLKTQGGTEAIVGKDSAENGIYKYSEDNQTGADGILNMPDMEFGVYEFSNFSASGQSLDLIVSYPYPAISGGNETELFPGTTQEVKLGLRAGHTLLVTVQDNDTLDPLFSAGVRIYKTGYDSTKPTDLGGNVYFIPLEKSVYTLEVALGGYDSYSGNISVNGRTEKIIKLDKL